MMSEDEKERYLMKQQRYVARMRNRRISRRPIGQKDNDYKGINWFQMIMTSNGSELHAVLKIIGGFFLIVLIMGTVYLSEILEILPQVDKAFKSSLSIVIVLVAFVVAQEKSNRYGYLLWFDKQAHYTGEARFRKATIFFIINFVVSGAFIACIWIVFVDTHWNINYGDGKPLTGIIALINIIVPVLVEAIITGLLVRWINKNDPELITY